MRDEGYTSKFWFSKGSCRRREWTNSSIPNTPDRNSRCAFCFSFILLFSISDLIAAEWSADWLWFQECLPSRIRLPRAEKAHYPLFMKRSSTFSWARNERLQHCMQRIVSNDPRVIAQKQKISWFPTLASDGRQTFSCKNSSTIILYFTVRKLTLSSLVFNEINVELFTFYSFFFAKVVLPIVLLVVKC